MRMPASSTRAGRHGDAVRPLGRPAERQRRDDVDQGCDEGEQVGQRRIVELGQRSARWTWRPRPRRRRRTPRPGGDPRWSVPCLPQSEDHDAHDDRRKRHEQERWAAALLAFLGESLPKQERCDPDRGCGVPEVGDELVGPVPAGRVRSDRLQQLARRRPGQRGARSARPAPRAGHPRRPRPGPPRPRGRRPRRWSRQSSRGHASTRRRRVSPTRRKSHGGAKRGRRLATCRRTRAGPAWSYADRNPSGLA